MFNGGGSTVSISVLVCILLAVFLVADVLIQRRFCTPVCFFAGIWLIILSAGSLRLYGFSGYTEQTAAIIFAGVCSFICGVYAIECLMQKCGMTRSKTSLFSLHDGSYSQLLNNVPVRSDVSVNMHFLNVILALSFAGHIISFWYTFRAMLSGLSLGEVRGNLMGYSGDYVIGNPIIDAYYVYFCTPAMTVLLPLAVVFFFQKRHQKFVGVTMLCFLMQIVSRGGRMGIVDLILMIIVCFVYFRRKLSRRTKRLLLAIIVSGVIAMGIIGVARGNNEIFRNVYTYFTISAPMFERYSQAFLQADFVSYGGATFYPFMYLIDAFTNIMGGNMKFSEELVYFVGYPQDTWLSGIYPTGELNAFSSEFYFFYMDFRLFGVLIFSFMHGAICSFFYVRSFKQHNTTMLLWYLLMVHGMFFSFIIWQLGNTKFFVSMMILVVAQLTAQKTCNCGDSLHIYNRQLKLHDY